MTSKCITCLSNLPNETLYRCQTCHREQDEASGFEYFCENCLVSHIRKGHSVIDCKGNKPLVCSTHSLICLEYCKTCDVTLCYKCLGSHSKHEFQPAEVKGSELKRKVFELLTDLEMKEKPLRLKQEETIRKNQEIAQRLEEFIKGELKKLEENVREKINQKSTANDRLSGELTTACNDLLSLQGRTRALLSQSNANLAHNYAIVAEECSNFESRYNDSIKKESDCFVSVTDSVNKLFESFRIEFDELLETANSSHFQANQIFHVIGVKSWSKMLIYRVQRNHHKELSVSTITFDGNGRQIITEIAVESMKGNIEITHVFIVKAVKTDNVPNTERKVGPSCRKAKKFEQIIVLMNNRTAKLYNISSGAFERCTYPRYNNFLWPYCASDLNIHWSYWNADEKKVRFSHSFDLSFDCDHCPKIRMNGSDSNILCFIDQNCTVFVVELSFGNIENDRIEKIDKETHHLETIDCISSVFTEVGSNLQPTIEMTQLFLWSVDSTSVTIVHKLFNSQEPFSFYRRVYWDNELTKFHFEVSLQKEDICIGN